MTSPTIAELQGEIARLRHIVAVLKFHISSAYSAAKTIEENVRCRDGTVEVWCFGEWVDVRDVNEEEEEEDE